MENKKIKNTEQNKDKLFYDGIQFKSNLEVMVYKTLQSEGITPLYEKKTITVWKGFKPTVPLIVKNKFKRKNKNLKPVGKYAIEDWRKLDDITYTPDFYFEYNNKKIFIEAKGHENDVFPYKFKWFRQYIENLEDKDSYEIWKVLNKRQLVECINNLKNNVQEF